MCLRWSTLPLCTLPSDADSLCFLDTIRVHVRATYITHSVPASVDIGRPTVPAPLTSTVAMHSHRCASLSAALCPRRAICRLL